MLKNFFIYEYENIVKTFERLHHNFTIIKIHANMNCIKAKYYKSRIFCVPNSLPQYNFSGHRHKCFPAKGIRLISDEMQRSNKRGQFTLMRSMKPFMYLHIIHTLHTSITYTVGRLPQVMPCLFARLFPSLFLNLLSCPGCASHCLLANTFPRTF